jgi:4a-hydroxytetrahydrobiopterin dehydratase
MKALTKRQITIKLKSLHCDWEISKNASSITRKFLFRNYILGYMFVTKVSIRAEVANHHPEVLLTYNSVKITLTTNELKSLTEDDLTLAHTIDSLYDLSTVTEKGTHNHY